MKTIILIYGAIVSTGFIALIFYWLSIAVFVLIAEIKNIFKNKL